MHRPELAVWISVVLSERSYIAIALLQSTEDGRGPQKVSQAGIPAIAAPTNYGHTGLTWWR